MNGYHLKYFHDTCLLKNLTLAAKLNHVSQSAISQAIRSIESLLNAELIIHKKNQLLITEKGKLVFEESKKVLMAIDNLKSKIDPKGENLKGQLTVGANAAVLQCVLPGVIQKYSKTHPGISLNIVPGSCQDIKEKTKKGLVDLGLVIESSDAEGLCLELIQTCHYKLFSRKVNHQQRILIGGDNYPEIIALKEHLKNKKAYQNYQFEIIPHGETIKRLLLEGYGIGYLPSFFFSKSELKSKVKTVSNFSHLCQIHALYLPHMKESIRTQNLLNECRMP